MIRMRSEVFPYIFIEPLYSHFGYINKNTLTLSTPGVQATDYHWGSIWPHLQICDIWALSKKSQNIVKFDLYTKFQVLGPKNRAPNGAYNVEEKSVK